MHTCVEAKWWYRVFSITLCTIFLRQNFLLNPDLGFPARWVASQSSCHLVSPPLSSGVTSIGWWWLTLLHGFRGSERRFLCMYSEEFSPANHPLMPWENVFTLLICIVDSHDQIDGFVSIVMISIWSLSPTSAYVLKTIFQCHIQRWGFLRSDEIMPILTSLMDEPIDRFIML